MRRQIDACCASWRVGGTYMWDFPGGGSPVYPVNQAIKSLGGTPRSRPSPGFQARSGCESLCGKSSPAVCQIPS